MTSPYRGGAGQERAGRRPATSSAPAVISPVTPQPEHLPGDQLTVNDAAQEVVRLANRALTLNDAYRSAARRDADTARKHAQTQFAHAQQRIREGETRSRSTAMASERSVVASLAPDVLSQSWQELEYLQRPAGILDAASYVRVGELRLIGSQGGVIVPLLVPLLDHGSLLVSAPSDHPAVGGLVQEVALRCLLGTGAGQLSLSTYDPHLRGYTAPFTALRQVSDELVPPTLASSDELRELLEDLSRDVRRISEMYGGVPTTLGEFRHAARQPIERYQLVVLLNYPVGFDDRAHALLRTLLRTGPACGISFIIHHDTNARQPDDFTPIEIYQHATIVRVGAPTTVDGLDGYLADVGAAPSLAVIEPAIAELQSRAKEAAAPKVSFDELQPAESGYWQESSDARITAVIGRAGHQPVEITLGDEREQRHNMLVSGAVGQGKSNLLMVLVHSWSVRYSPDELQLFLLDFKDGVTLYPLAPHSGQTGWLPHARVLGLESDRAFGAAVLQFLVDEFERRAAIIRPFGDNITRFREQRPDASMPRLVVVIDEFQVLFEEDDDLTRSALLNLERLAKKGRAYGIHLVLASQTLSGITAMLSKQDGIFAQFPIRLALKNSAGESRAVLDQQNTEAARLRYRGELIVNTDFGQVEANRRAVVALADPDELARLRVKLWERASRPISPSVFNGAAAADLITALESIGSIDPEEPCALIGLPVAVTPRPATIPMPAESGRHLSIVGAGDSAADRSQSAGAVMLQSAAASLAVQHQPGSVQFVIVNLLAAKSPDQVVVERLQDLIAVCGHNTATRGSRELSATLAELDGAISERRDGADPTPVYLVAFGMDRAPNLRIPDPATFVQPIDGLHTLWREGSALGIHVLGWWGNVRSYNDQLGMEASGTVDALALLRVSSQDVIDLFGPFVSWTSPGNRALVRDVAQANEPSVVVPFAGLTTKDLDRLRRERMTR